MHKCTLNNIYLIQEEFICLMLYIILAQWSQELFFSYLICSGLYDNHNCGDHILFARSITNVMISFNFKPGMVGFTSVLKIEKQTKQIILISLSHQNTLHSLLVLYTCSFIPIKWWFLPFSKLLQLLEHFVLFHFCF